MYLLARDHLDDDQSRGALWLLAAYPFAVFYGAIYTESFFLLGATGAFYHTQRGESVRAGLWALVVGLTRPNGFLLSVPLAVLAISPRLPAWLVRVSHDRAARADEMRRTSSVPALAAAAMPVVGMLMYSVFVWSLTGNPLAWMAGHLAWGRRYTGLTALIIDRYNWVAGALNAVDDSIIDVGVQGAINDRLRIELFVELGLRPDDIIVPARP